MEPKEDAIVDIPKDRMRFFGGAGKMLLPGPATVAALIEKVPARKLITTNLLCQKLTQQFKARGTCPVTTQKALQAVAHDASNEVAYWRVIKANGGLLTRFPVRARYAMHVYTRDKAALRQSVMYPGERKSVWELVSSFAKAQIADCS